MGRQLLTAEGELAPPANASDCSGGNPDNQKTGKSYNRWSLMLDQLDWKNNRFKVIKPLLDTSTDPATGVSRSRITGGAMKGAIIKSAYDPSVAKFGGITYVAFECIIQNGGDYKVSGTSSCIGVYDPKKRSIDLSRTRVLISGVVGANFMWAAAIPHLFAYKNKLYVYWTANLWKNGQLSDWRVRGTRLLPTRTGVAIKGGGDKPAPATTPLAVDVWQRNSAGPMSGKIFDLFGTFQSRNTLYIMYASGGDDCTSPASNGPGCYRPSIAAISEPLRPNVFNEAKPVKMNLPTNPVEYAIPVIKPNGQMFMMGHFIRPKKNGYSEINPTPAKDFWDSQRKNSIYARVPFKLN
ncbi:hypothetical protein [Sphingobium chlorophenolicum]|nr:hypothetical protein [Sphingobium chlorophenolicum]